MKADLNIEAFG